MRVALSACLLMSLGLCSAQADPCRNARQQMQVNASHFNATCAGSSTDSCLQASRTFATLSQEVLSLCGSRLNAAERSAFETYHARSKAYFDARAQQKESSRRAFNEFMLYQMYSNQNSSSINTRINSAGIPCSAAPGSTGC